MDRLIKVRLTLTNYAMGHVHIGTGARVDRYDFNMDGRIVRDFATWWGRPGGANEGRDFDIMGYVQATVPVKY